MDNTHFSHNGFDFLSLQSALPNSTQDGKSNLPTSLDWDDSQYSGDSRFMGTASHDSFSSSATAINTPCLNNSGITTPENYSFWDSSQSRDNSTIRYNDTVRDSHERWRQQMSSLAIAGYLESQFTHSLCTTNLEGRTPRDVSSLSFQDDQCAPRRKHQMELSKADCLGSEFISTSDITRSPKQHAGISVARNCKRNSPCIKSEEHRPVKKTAHNMIEKRYRNKLNDSIAELRDNIPSLRPGGPRMAGEVDPMPKLYKATVITKAVEYISFLEKEISRLMDENEHLRSRIRPAGEKTLPAHSLIQYGQTDCAENES